MRLMKLNRLAQAVGLLGLSMQGLVYAQTATLQRVEITGSSIKRIAAEGALPVQIFSRDSIEKSGIATAEQFIATLTGGGNGTDNLVSLGGNASQGSTANPDGNNNLGNSSANLRGLGPQNTLILLNGRRVSTHGLKGSTVDLGSIPMGAIDRIEILRDGASAIYGTDAIGGVINFILRRSFNGLEATAGTDVTQEGGGRISKASAVFGIGSLDADRYNLMVAVSKSKNDRLSADQRDFANLGHNPAMGVAQESIGTPYATQTTSGTRFALRGGPVYSNANLLALQGNCDSGERTYPYADNVTGVTSRHYGCSYDYAGRAMLQQPFEATSLVSRLNVQIAPDHLAFVEVVGSHTDARKEYEPNQITSSGSGAGASLVTRYVYPVGGPYYQNLATALTGTGMTFDPNSPIGIRWRCMECGPRIVDTTSNNQRLVLGLEGVVGGMDYKLGAMTGSATSKSVLTSGYLYADALNTALASGQINPWLANGATQSAAGMAQLDSARADGLERLNGKTFVHEFDGALSGELFALPAGPMAFALGASWRREGYSLDYNPAVLYAALPDASFISRERDIKAIYGEVLIPITKQLDTTLAIRTDDYSDFGRTTNPKISVRYQPSQNLLFRGSANSGFRAPSFGQLYTAAPDPNAVMPQITSARNDPSASCPTAGIDYCSVRFSYLTGGNVDLKPEKSKQVSFGFVAEPVDWVTLSADFWRVGRTDVIGYLSAETVLDNYAALSQFVVRNSSGAIDYIRAGRINASAVATAGVDLGVKLRGKLGAGTWDASLAGSYLDLYKEKLLATSPWTDRVGKFSNQDLHLRWKHNLSFTYSERNWSGTVAQSYIDGYDAYVWPTGVTQPGGKVDSYIRYNITGSYSGFKNAKVNFGINNLFNVDPPFSVHHSDEVSGTSWDPRVGDPRGRSYFVNVTYKFF